MAEQLEEQTAEQLEEQSVEQPEEQTVEQPEQQPEQRPEEQLEVWLEQRPEQRPDEQVEKQQGIHHHHRIHHDLITGEPEEGECLDNRGELKNWNSPNQLRLKNLKSFLGSLGKILIPGGC